MSLILLTGTISLIQVQQAVFLQSSQHDIDVDITQSQSQSRGKTMVKAVKLLWNDSNGSDELEPVLNGSGTCNNQVFLFATHRSDLTAKTPQPEVFSWGLLTSTHTPDTSHL